MRDADQTTIGVEFTQSSDAVCDGDTKFSILNKITCEEDTAAAGYGVPTVVKDDCVYTISMKHAAGCPTLNIDLEVMMSWLDDNTWCIGLIYLIAGPIIALFGTAWFPWVCAGLIAIFVFGTILFASLSFGWMTGTVGIVVTFILALVLAILCGMLVRRKIWLMVGLLGLVAGFFSGSLVATLIYSMTGNEAVWMFWVISVVMAGIGCALACYLGKTVVLMSTSMVGSYLFMRSWTLFFPGNYPNETELANKSTELELTGTFWIFIAVFLVGFAGSVAFQCKWATTHEELDDDDDFKAYDD